MAFNTPFSFLFALFCLFAAANVSRAQLITIRGAICCNANLTCPGSPVANQPISLVCPNLFGGNSTIATTVTSANGTYTFNVPNVLTVATNILACRAVVQVPLSGVVCPVLSTTTGTLSAAVAILNVIVGLLGTAINAVNTGFVIQSPI